MRMSARAFGLQLSQLAQLPQLTADRPPAFVDAPACRDWLAGMAAEQAHQRQALLLQQLNLLNRYALPVATRHALLELLRAAVQLAHAETTTRFSARAVPLTPPEQAAFDTCQALWQALETAYLHCLQAYLQQHEQSQAAPLAGASSLSLHMAQVAARALACLSAMYLDSCRASMLPAQGYWRRLHQLHHLLEQHQLARLTIEDAQRAHSLPGAASTTTASAIYSETLLLAAAHPLTLSAQALTQVASWARLWAHRPELRTTPPGDRRTPPLHILIDSDTAGSFQPPATTYAAPSANLRWLDMTALRMTLKQILGLLENKDAHGAAAAAQDERLRNLWCDAVAHDRHSYPDAARHASSAGIDLLRQVYQDWCRGGRPQPDGKTTLTGNYRLLSGMAAIHASLGDDRDSDCDGDGDCDSNGEAGWQKLGDEIGQLRLQRQFGAAGARTGKRWLRTQLLLVQTAQTLPSGPDSTADQHAHPLLGSLQWLALSHTRDQLHIGIQLLPGRPTAVRWWLDERSAAQASASVQTPAASANINTDTQPGLLLPAIPGLREPASLLLAPAAYKPGQALQISTLGTLSTPSTPNTFNATRKIYLRDLLDSGVDFVRCSFVEG